MDIIQKALINYICNNNSKNVLKQKQRNYGIDLLRIFSMINVINLHINRKAGIFRLNSNNIKFKNMWRLETFSYFAVNCFGLISGIVGFNKYKFSNLIYLWFISTFYSLSNQLYLYFVKRINIKQIFLSLSFLPIFIKFHWYVNAYFIMYLFLPFINFGIASLDKKTFRNIVLFYIIFFSIYYIVSVLFKKPNDHFLLNGYSSSWLIILYIIGSYFGKYILKSNNNKINWIIIIFFLINYIGLSFLSSEIYIITGQKFLISYLSPTILFQAICLVMIFDSIKITNKYITKTIKFITPLVFSATLIHSLLFCSNLKIVLSLFELIKELNNEFLFYKIYILSTIIFLICIIIDYFRLLIFKIVKIRDICLFIERKFPKLIDKFLLIINFFLIN